MLFSGRLRESLDPFEEYEDLELWTALSQVSLKINNDLGRIQIDWIIKIYKSFHL